MLERVGCGVCLVTPAPSKTRLRRMEAESQGSAGGFSTCSGVGARQSRIVRSARNRASRGRAPSAYSAPESARMWEPGAAFASEIGKSRSEAPLAHPRPG